MEDCIFCKIIKGEIPTNKVYENDILMVIMNIDPVTNGHMLVIPKKHQVNIFDIDKDFLSEAFEIIKNNIYPLLKEKLNCEGLTILNNNELGQEIKHFHIHLIPRYENDEADINTNKNNLKSVEEIFNTIK